MIVGVPAEIKSQENRIGAVPAVVNMLVVAGHTVLVEKGGGLRRAKIGTGRGLPTEMAAYVRCGHHRR